MNLDFILYAFMNTILIVLGLLAFRFYSGLGAFGGLLGAIFSYICFTSENLIIGQAYDQTAQTFVYQLYPMGVFAWLPLLLTGLCFVGAIKGK